MTLIPARPHGEAETGTGTECGSSRGRTAGTGRGGHGDSPQSPQGTLRGCCGRDSVGDAESRAILGGMWGLEVAWWNPKNAVTPLVGCGSLPALGRW